MRCNYLLGCTAVALAAASASGFEFRTRWVERIGNTDVVIPGNDPDFSDGAPRRIRLQVGVFDDAAGPAPAGGFVGWNFGTISVTGAANNSIERRTPGRLAPFNFLNNPHSNGNPPVPAGGDVDFQMLTEIDAAMGPQSPAWLCSPAPGEAPLPQPLPTVRGLNSFVSVFELTVDPADGATQYRINFGGNLVAALEWRVVGVATPPDCGDPNNPNDNIPGAVLYAPITTDPVAFNAVLRVLPTPGVLSLLCMGGLFAARRRR